MHQVAEILLAAALAATHALAGKLAVLEKLMSPRRWLSFSGGVSVSYVFIVIFPELAARQVQIEAVESPFLGFFEHHIYLLSLFGLAAFYGLEDLARTSRQRNEARGGEAHTSRMCFRLHVGAFAIYNGIIGWLLHDMVKEDLGDAVFMAVAIALHFVVNDNALRSHHRAAYDRIGRWILAAAVPAGAALSHLAQLDDAAVAALWAIVVGGIILNVLKEELPGRRESCYPSFLAGLVLYTIVLLLR